MAREEPGAGGPEGVGATSPTSVSGSAGGPAGAAGPAAACRCAVPPGPLAPPTPPADGERRAIRSKRKGVPLRVISLISFGAILAGRRKILRSAAAS